MLKRETSFSAIDAKANPFELGFFREKPNRKKSPKWQGLLISLISFAHRGSVLEEDPFIHKTLENPSN